MIRITAVRMIFGSDPLLDQIERLRWVSMNSSQTGENTLAEMVAFIEAGEKIIITDGPFKIPVEVKSAKVPYLHTVWNGEETEHLLDLPGF